MVSLLLISVSVWQNETSKTHTSADHKEICFLHSDNSDRIKIVEHIQSYFCDSQVVQWPALIFPKLQIPSLLS